MLPGLASLLMQTIIELLQSCISTTIKFKGKSILIKQQILRTL
jgi:hypothetical protein